LWTDSSNIDAPLRVENDVVQTYGKAKVVAEAEQFNSI
jgi:hypothetical protein